MALSRCPAVKLWFRWLVAGAHRGRGNGAYRFPQAFRYGRFLKDVAPTLYAIFGTILNDGDTQLCIQCMDVFINPAFR